MGIRQYIREKLDSVRAAYHGSHYIVSQTDRSYKQIGKLIDGFEDGKLSPEKFAERLQEAKSRYEDSIKDRNRNYTDRKVSHDYEDFLKEAIGVVKRNASRAKVNKTARLDVANDLRIKYVALRSQILSDITGPRSEKEEKEEEAMFKKYEKQEGLEGIFRAVFYVFSALLIGYIILNSKITGFSISENMNSMAGKVIGIVFLVSLILFVLTKKEIKYAERGTIKLPHLNDRFIGTEYDKKRDVWIVKYESPEGMAMQAIQDTHVPLPTDDPNKIVYEDVRTGRERGKKAKKE